MQSIFKGSSGDISISGTVKDRNGLSYSVNVTDRSADTKLVWHLDIGEKDWGLHRLSISVPDQTLELSVQLECFELDKDLEDVNLILTLSGMTTDVRPGDGGEALLIDDVELDVLSSEFTYDAQGKIKGLHITAEGSACAHISIQSA